MTTTDKLHQDTFGNLRIGSEFTIVDEDGKRYIKYAEFTSFDGEYRIANARRHYDGMSTWVDADTPVWVIPPTREERTHQVARDAAMCLADVDARERAMFLVALVGAITREPEMCDAAETLRTLAVVATQAAKNLDEPDADPKKAAHGIVWAIRRLVSPDEAAEILSHVSVEAAYAADDVRDWSAWTDEQHEILDGMEVMK
jgi:hypothetical protein